MAITAEGRRLTEIHRQAQIEVSTETIRDVDYAFRQILDLERIEQTFPDYFEASSAVVARDNRESRVLSSAYLAAFEDAEGVATRPLDLREAGAVAREQAMNSLFFTGPAHYRAARAKGESVARSRSVARRGSVRAAKRLALQGGRRTITDTIQASDSMKGVARVTDGDPCSFCAMLAARGAVYKSQQTARFKPHDGCGCQPEPVYTTSGSYTMPGRGQEFANLYGQVPGGLSAADTRRAFRGLYERGAVPKKYLPDA